MQVALVDSVTAKGSPRRWTSCVNRHRDKDIPYRAQVFEDRVALILQVTVDPSSQLDVAMTQKCSHLLNPSSGWWRAKPTVERMSQAD